MRKNLTDNLMGLGVKTLTDNLMSLGVKLSDGKFDEISRENYVFKLLQDFFENYGFFEEFQKTNLVFSLLQNFM